MVLSSLIGLTLACSSSSGVTFPVNAVPLSPPAAYQLWWDMVEHCASRAGNLGEVSWFIVPDTEELVIDSERYHGMWWGEGNRIVLAEQAVFRGRVVRHEMLHAILRGQGHPRQEFAENCGGIVACDGECAEDIGAVDAVPAHASELSVAALSIATALDPASVSRTEYGGWFALTISITNPLAEPIWVPLSRLEPGHDAAMLFGFEIDGSIKDYLWTYDQRIGFGAHETKRFSFDINTHNSEGTIRLEAGQHAIRGLYNDRSQELPLVVAP